MVNFNALWRPAKREIHGWKVRGWWLPLPIRGYVVVEVAEAGCTCPGSYIVRLVDSATHEVVGCSLEFKRVIDSRSNRLYHPRGTTSRMMATKIAERMFAGYFLDNTPVKGASCTKSR